MSWHDINHFLQEGERFAASRGYHSPTKVPVHLSLQKLMEDVGAENDSDREEVEIFVPDPNMEKSDANEWNYKAKGSSSW